MEILWLGHACFRLKGNRRTTLLFDPFPDALGLSMGQPEASIVTISNDNPNHSHSSGVSGQPSVLSRPGEYDVGGAYIRGIPLPPLPDGATARRNTAFVVDMDGLSICHLGDLAQPISSQKAKEMAAHILMLPVGGNCTISPAQAAELVALLQPRLVLPMHYSMPGLPFSLEPVENFLREMGAKATEPQARLNMTVATLPQETTTLLMRPTGRLISAV